MNSSFRLTHSLKVRREEYAKITQKYPDRIPLICDRAIHSKAPIIDKQKFLVPTDITIGQFMYIIRKRVHLNFEIALFVTISGTIPPSSASMLQLYDAYRDADGFLYIDYDIEHVFGADDIKNEIYMSID